MASDNNEFLQFMQLEKLLHTANRPLRLRLCHAEGVSEDMLLPQQVFGTTAVCGALEYRVLCLSTSAVLPLKQLIALPAAIDIVPDRGDLCSVCGIVAEASAGDSDGGVATYQLVLRDALSIMEKRINTRVFRHLAEIDIVKLIIGEWRQASTVLAAAFHCEVDPVLQERAGLPREFTMQHNESDAAFIRRLLKRRGIAWFFRAGASAGTGPAAVPVHTMVMFNDADSLRQSAAGSVRYHRDAATEERDSLTSWSAVRTLQPASTAQHSWDYSYPLGPHFMTSHARGTTDQGHSGNDLAALLDDYQVLAPHVGNDHENLCSLGRLRMQRHDLEAKCFHAEGSVRDLCVGEYFNLSGHPEVDTHAVQEREFVVTALRVNVRNNLPAALLAKAERLFARHRWMQASGAGTEDDFTVLEGSPVRMQMQLTAVRRGIPIVPAFDAATDMPHPHLQSALVVGPTAEEVHCDQLGRVKIRFPATRAQDHEHAHGAGAADNEADSAWVRVASNWAGNGAGSLHQCGTLGLPRIGAEVLVAFMGGDPDKPIIVGQLYNQNGQPPALSSAGELPGNRYLSGIKSREIKGQRGNQLRFDDGTGQISAQLASDHGASQLNLGWLTRPKTDGHGAPRGEGAELRSDQAVAVRGGKGVLISAHGAANGEDIQLERAALIGVADLLQGVANQLGKLAGTHAKDQTDDAELSRLLGILKHWHQGSNVAKGGGTPDAIVAATAPDGMILSSQASMLVGAENTLQMVSASHAHLASGQGLFLRAARGISVFAHQLGLKLIAASGNVLVQAHQGDIELSATGKIRLTAGEGIEIQAPAVRIVAQGAQADYGGGTITQQSSGPHAIKSSLFAHSQPGGGSVPEVSFPTTSLKADERVVLRDRQTMLPIKNRRFCATLDDGRSISGSTDADGCSELLESAAMQNASIDFFPEES